MYIDLLIKIKNAQGAGKKSLKTRYTKMDYAIVELLREAGFLKKAEVKGRSFKKVIEIYLNSEKLIQGLRFSSKPSLRRYTGYRDIKRVKGGYGLRAISTPRGILTGERARKEKVGGQLLFEIW